MLNAEKELTPVFYGESAVIILALNKKKAGRMCFGMHWHERMELIYVVNGSLSLDRGNGSQCVKSGSVAVISPEQPHCGIAGDEGVAYYTFMFDLTAFYNGTFAAGRILRPVSEKSVIFPGSTDRTEIIGILERMVELQKEQDTGNALTEVGLIYELFGQLYRYCAVQQQSGAVLDKRFRNVLDYLNKNYCEDISSVRLSREFGYDEAYFCRRFKAVTGLSPMVYIRILRLEKAKKLLSDSESTVAQIASVCGFFDAGYFTRCFKRHYGLSPVAYRVKKSSMTDLSVR